MLDLDERGRVDQQEAEAALRDEHAPQVLHPLPVGNGGRLLGACAVGTGRDAHDRRDAVPSGAEATGSCGATAP